MSEVLFTRGITNSGGGVRQAGPIGSSSRRQSIFARAKALIRFLFRAFLFVVLAPFRAIRAIRRRMTAASVAVLLIGITTLNIIWGYPWVGMFAASIALMVIGSTANYLMRPGLRIGFSLPAYTPAGQPCSIVTHATNTRRIPALDATVGLCAPREHRNHGASGRLRISTAGLYFEIARPGQRIDVPSTVIYQRRGMEKVPTVQITTSFPFHLFRHRQLIASDTAIAVTPALLTGEEDAAANALLHAIGNWSHRLFSGDALDYTGSREYQPGMPVRRWDFSSWARLGRPIVREFQSPSVQSVLLLIDTTVSPDHEPAAASELVERVLSLAATTINDLTSKSIRVQLYLTCDDPPEDWRATTGTRTGADNESMQIRLAKATESAANEADDHLAQVMRDAAGTPTLLITSRRNFDQASDLRGKMEMICVDQDDFALRSSQDTGKNSGSHIDEPHELADRSRDLASNQRSLS